MSHSNYVVAPYPGQRPPQPQLAARQSATVRWLAILLLVVAGALVFLVIDQRRGGGSSTPPASVLKPQTPIIPKDLGADEQATIQVFETASNAVVHIATSQSGVDQFTARATEQALGTGTGFVWDESGYIVTNFHVIKDGDRFKVTMADGTVYDASKVGAAPDKDLAVLRISGAPTLQKLAVGSSSHLKVGQKVLAIGNPFGFDHTLTTGVISGLGREIQSVTNRPIYDVIQTDAAINPGNSGGPLLDSQGNLIGVNTAIFSPSGAYAGIGFAVPVDTVNSIVPQIIATNGQLDRPGLGIAIAGDHVAARVGIKGVIVQQVSPGGAADRAGLVGVQRDPSGRSAIGDVIVSLGGMKVENQMDLFRALDKHKVGEAVDVVVSRNGQERTLQVTLQSIPQ